MRDYEINKVQFATFARNGFTPDLKGRSKNEGIYLIMVDSLVNRA
jgi:hypothetical protein